MKIALAQLNYHTGNFEKNTQKIIDSIRRAGQQGAAVVVFSELAVCGYPPRDFLEFHHFLTECEASVKKIAGYCHNIATVVGAPSRNTGPKGKPLHNSAYFLAQGKILAKVDKTLLPTYDIFDEYRYFEPNTEFKVVEYNGFRIALTICEDIWNVDENPIYRENPMAHIIQQEPDFGINIAASPFSYSHDQVRKYYLKTTAKTYHLPFLYVNHVGAQTELIFDGGSCLVNAKGENCGQLEFFREQVKTYDLSSMTPLIEKELPKLSRIPLIHRALLTGIADYFRKLGFQKAILGLSGGIDSALVLVLAAQVLGKENVLAILMPSQYSTEGSVKDAKLLCGNLGIEYHTLPIAGIFDQFQKELAPYFKNLPENIAEENIQARARAVLLMAMSNKFGHVLLNTSNKSELAVGYGTLYGDLCGGLSVIGDVYKTEVYQLAEYINRDKTVIPASIINKFPSAELKPGQKDTDTLPAYEKLDPILYQYIEKRLGPEEIIQKGFEEKTVRKVLKMVNQSEYKRFQSPPILRISEKAFGMGRRLPIVAKYLS